MHDETPVAAFTTRQEAIETAISLALIFLLAAWCFKILSPFLSVVLWGAIIAIALHKPFGKLAGLVGGRPKLFVDTRIRWPDDRKSRSRHPRSTTSA